MQRSPTKLAPDVRNNRSTPPPGSILLKLLCCSLRENFCRWQAEMTEHVTCLSGSAGTHSALLSLGSQESLLGLGQRREASPGDLD